MLEFKFGTEKEGFDRVYSNNKLQTVQIKQNLIELKNVGLTA